MVSGRDPAPPCRQRADPAAVGLGRGAERAREGRHVHRRHGRRAGGRPGRERAQEPADDARRAVLEVVEGRDVAGVRHLDERRVREAVATCCASATGVDWSNSPFRTSTGIDGRAPPPGNGGGPIRGCGQSRQPRTSSRSTTVRSQTRFENGANTFGERCRMAFARVARRGRAGRPSTRPSDSHGRRPPGSRPPSRSWGFPRKVERHVLGGQAEHRRPVAVAERHERARQVAEDGVGVGRVVHQVAEFDRPEPDVPPHAVGVRPASR